MIEGRFACTATRARGRGRIRVSRVSPVDGDRSARIVGTELDRVDLRTLEHHNAAGARMLEQQVVELGANLVGSRRSQLHRVWRAKEDCTDDVPRAVVYPEGHKVGVCAHT